MRLRWILLLVVFVVTSLFLFSQPSNANFVSDDWDWLWASHNQDIWPSLLTNYTGGRSGGSYNPMSSLWINILYRISGLTPQPYHIASIVLHAVNAWLVAVLAFLWMRRARFSAAVLAGVLFFVWPTHVEAINWISSAPHLLATFFFLATLIFYLKSRESGRPVFFVASCVSALLAFFSKETAISLPFILVALEIGHQFNGGKFFARRYALVLVILLEALFFMVMRHGATQLWFSSYADARFIVRPITWAHTVFTFFEEMLTLGFLRVPWSAFFFQKPALGIVIGFLVLGALVYILRRFTMRDATLTLMLFFITLAPFIPLGFNRLSQEGERYTYLPSVFFILLLSLILTRLRRLGIIIVVMILAASVPLIVQKNGAWRDAGMVSSEIIQSLPLIAEKYPENTSFVFVGLPDTLGGAHVFRNNVREAVRLTYPHASASLVQIPVYLVLTRADGKDELMSWTSDDRGFLAKTKNGRFIVTGRDRAETDTLIYELWNYDYSNFTSDTMRLIFKPDFLDSVKRGAAVLVTWNGRLMSLDYNAGSQNR